MTEPTPVEPANQVLTTETEPAVLGPKTRILRTILQVVAALAVSIPTLAQAFNMTEANTAKVTAAMGFITVVASIVHNTWDSKSAPPDNGYADLGWVLRVFAFIAFVVVGLMGANWIFHNAIHIFAWLGFGLAAYVLAGFGTVAGFPSNRKNKGQNP